MSKDYDDFLSRNGLTEDDVQKIMRALLHKNLVGFDWIIPIFSDIHGIGLTTTCYYGKGGHICPAVIDGVRTVGARYINHSDEPNVEFVYEGNCVHVIALCDIHPMEELTCDYQHNLERSGK